MKVLEISKILTVFLDDYRDFECVALATGLEADGKNKIGIDYSNFMELYEIQGLLSHLGYDVEAIEVAYGCKALDYINFEWWN